MLTTTRDYLRDPGLVSNPARWFRDGLSAGQTNDLGLSYAKTNELAPGLSGEESTRPPDFQARGAMSIAALKWAFPIPLTGPRKTVLIVLAEHADESGICWPAISRVTLFSGVCERSVWTALKDLEAAGLILVERSQGRKSNQYRLPFTSAPDADAIAAIEQSQGRKFGRTKNLITAPGACASDAINTAPGALNEDPGALHGMHSDGASDALMGAPHSKMSARVAPEPLEPSMNPQLTPKTLAPKKTASSSSRGTRLPDDWKPEPKDVDFAISLSLDANKLLDEFRDYWRSIPGYRGTKLDWPATWRNRCRDVAGRGGNTKPINGRAAKPTLSRLDASRHILGLSSRQDDEPPDWVTGPTLEGTLVQ